MVAEGGVLGEGGELAQPGFLVEEEDAGDDVPAVVDEQIDAESVALKFFAVEAVDFESVEARAQREGHVACAVVAAGEDVVEVADEIGLALGEGVGRKLLDFDGGEKAGRGVAEGDVLAAQDGHLAGAGEGFDRAALDAGGKLRGLDGGETVVKFAGCVGSQCGIDLCVGGNRRGKKANSKRASENAHRRGSLFQLKDEPEGCG